MELVADHAREARAEHRVEPTRGAVRLFLVCHAPLAAHTGVQLLRCSPSFVDKVR